MDGRTTIADRFLRLGGRFVAAGYLAIPMLVVPDVKNQATTVAVWWTPLAIAVVFGPGLGLGAFTFHRDPVWMRRMAMLAAAGYLVAAGTWLVAWRGTPLRGDQWLADMPALAGLAAAVVWRARTSLLVLVVAASLAAAINSIAREPQVNVPLVPDLLYAYGYSALLVAPVWMFTRSGRLLEVIQTDAFEGAASAAALRGRAAERARFAALTHDGVMSTLLAAARGSDRDAVRRQALRALNDLDDLERPLNAVLDAHETAAGLSAAVADIDPHLPVTVDVEPGTGRWGFPAAAVSVTAAAVGEAVRNSLRHAGIAARRRVDVRVDESGFQVVVSDDGVGFDATAEHTDRLGIAISIRARMRELVGGACSITSRPGAGVAVRLSWSGPMIDRRNTPDESSGPGAKSLALLGMRTLLGLRTRAAWLTLGLFLAAYAIAVAITPVMHSALLPNLACVALAAAAASGVLAVPGDPPPLGVSLAICTAGGPAQYAITATVAALSDNTTAQEWSLGSAAAICAFMCMRGRVVPAWVAMAAVLAEFGARIDLAAHPARVLAVPFLYLAPVLAATFFARVIGPTASAILDLRGDTLRRIAAEAAEAAAVAERDRQLRQLGRLTRPLLEVLAGSDPIDAVRDECALQEAELRDALRAPQLVDPPVVAATRAARGRGVKVLLYDEHGLDDVSADVRERVHARTVTELDHALDGSVIVRIRPPGRRPLVTIVVNGSNGTRRADLDQHARPLDRALEV